MSAVHSFFDSCLLYECHLFYRCNLLTLCVLLCLLSHSYHFYLDGLVGFPYIVHVSSLMAAGCQVPGYSWRITMEQNKLSSIILVSRTWRDNFNGNSYFSALAIVNGCRAIPVAYQYGSGSMIQDAAMESLEVSGIITDREQYKNGGGESMWRYCERCGIALMEIPPAATGQRDCKTWAESARFRFGGAR
jgi:hypothetical protein